MYKLAPGPLLKDPYISLLYNVYPFIYPFGLLNKKQDVTNMNFIHHVAASDGS